MNRLWIMAIAATGLAACGIPDSSSFTAIPDNEIPRAIRQTLPPTSTSTTTTTTTTTTLPTTTPTTIPGSTTTVGSTTTTTTVPSEQIQIYYVQGNRIRAVTITERSPVTVQRKLLDLTEREGMSSHPTRVATVLPIDATLISGLERGVVTVELGNSVDTILPVDLPLFFAQITLTALAPSRQGQVRFTQRGAPYPAVLGDGTVLDPGSPVAWEDYDALVIPETDVTTTTSTSTTVHLTGTTLGH